MKVTDVLKGKDAAVADQDLDLADEYGMLLLYLGRMQAAHGELIETLSHVAGQCRKVGNAADAFNSPNHSLNEPIVLHADMAENAALVAVACEMFSTASRAASAQAIKIENMELPENVESRKK